MPWIGGDTQGGGQEPAAGQHLQGEYPGEK